MVSRTLRMKAESSTTTTTKFLLELGAISRLRHRYGWARRLRPYELFDRRDQLILLYRLGKKCHCAFFDGAVAMFGAGAGGNDHHRNAPGGRALSQLHHQLVAGHARHF